jgi:hypothetical protein
MMTVNKPFAVVARYGTRNPNLLSIAPTYWEVFEVGRETEKRIYSLPSKPASSWMSDPYRTKAETQLARFDTKEEAEAFITSALAALRNEIRDRSQAYKEQSEAHARVGNAETALRKATLEFWRSRHDR